MPGQRPDDDEDDDEVAVGAVLAVLQGMGYRQVPVYAHGHQVQDRRASGEVVQREPYLTSLEYHRGVCTLYTVKGGLVVD